MEREEEEKTREEEGERTRESEREKRARERQQTSELDDPAGKKNFEKASKQPQPPSPGKEESGSALPALQAARDVPECSSFSRPSAEEPREPPLPGPRRCRSRSRPRRRRSVGRGRGR